MPCESCAVQFSVFKRKRACCECERYYCSGCLRRGGGTMCAPCRILSTRPLSRSTIAHLKVRDLQCFLQRQNVSTRGCVEKEELVSLCVSHVNSSGYRRRGQRAGGSPFSSLKGLTNNINDFINSAFDLRAPSAQPQQPHPARGYTSYCFNSAHAHASSPPAASDASPTTVPPQPNPERFTTRPSGEADIRVPTPVTSPSESRSTPDERVDTADCFEIEDLDDSGWEFVNRPADPLPNGATQACGGIARVLCGWRERLSTQMRRACPPPADSSEILMPVPPVGRRHSMGAGPEAGPRAELRDVRAASELDLNIHDDNTDTNTDSASLQDEPISQRDTGTPKHISVEQFKEASELDLLSVKQLKELLTRSRVEYRGCLERTDLLDRAKTLWKNHQIYKDELESLPLEECCKICMAAPLECVLLECGHIAACTRCSAQLAECPICRQYVVRAVRFFRS